MNQTITVKAGTTLFHIAVRYLGDATQWTRIARLNDMNDPFLKQITTLNIPSVQIARSRGSVRES